MEGRGGGGSGEGWGVVIKMVWEVSGEVEGGLIKNVGIAQMLAGEGDISEYGPGQGETKFWSPGWGVLPLPPLADI